MKKAVPREDSGIRLMEMKTIPDLPPRVSAVLISLWAAGAAQVVLPPDALGAATLVSIATTPEPP